MGMGTPPGMKQSPMQNMMQQQPMGMMPQVKPMSPQMPRGLPPQLAQALGGKGQQMGGGMPGMGGMQPGGKGQMPMRPLGMGLHTDPRLPQRMY